MRLTAGNCRNEYHGARVRVEKKRISRLFLQLDILGALTLGMIVPIFTFLFTDIFDSLSTFLGVSEVGGFIEKDGQPKNVGKALFVDAIATTISGLSGTSSGTTYIESASGVEEGGRTGLTAVVTGLLFLPFMFFSPLLSFIPSVATAPILVLIGLFMMKQITKINFRDLNHALPAFIIMVMIALSYSISTGLAFGFIAYTLTQILDGKIAQIKITMWIITLLSVLYFCM